MKALPSPTCLAKEKSSHQAHTITEWLGRPSPVRVESFTGTLGQTSALPDDRKQFFQLFFSDELIVKETNTYAALRKGDDPFYFTYFLQFQILMGIVDEPELRDYWSRNPRLHYPAISTRISRDRFEELTRYIHFVDNDTLLNFMSPELS